MRISFDLDGCLFVDPDKVESEPLLRFPWRLLFQERLRKGAPELLRRLSAEGHEVFIYTTSFRTAGYIKGYFKRHRVRLAGIVNGEDHQNRVQAGHAEILPSKMPTRFRIALHVDDDLSVRRNGDAYGFKVILVNVPEPLWAGRVLREIERTRF